MVSIVLCASCHIGNNGAPVSTPYFDSAIVTAERMYDSGNKMKALVYINDVHAHTDHLTIQDEMNYYAYCNTIYMKYLKDYDRSIALADTMNYILQKTGYIGKLPIRRIQIYNIKADALLAKGLYTQAYDNYFKAKALASETADSCELSEYSYKIGMVLYQQQKYLEAADYFKQSFKESRSCLDIFTYFYLRQELLDNTGLAYGRAKEFDSANKYYRKAIQYIDEHRGKYPNKNNSVYETAEAVVFGNLADVFAARQMYDTAETLLKKSISVNLQKGFTNSDAELDQLKLANIYLSEKKADSLAKLLNAVRVELDTIPNKYVELQWNKLTWQMHALRHDSAGALRYALAYNVQNDSFQSANKALMESDIETSAKIAERQYRIYSLETEKFQQRIYLIIAVVIAVMAIFISILVIRYSTKADKNVKTLTLLNNKINDQKEKLENALQELEFKNKDNSRILRSVAHDVMSPIAAIAALTDILVTESTDYSEEHKEIFDLIKEACGNSLSLSKDILEAAATIAPGVLHKEQVDINKLVSGSIELLGFRATEKQQHLVVHTAQQNIHAFVNKEKIWRVINNLVMNAIKFSYPGSDIHIYTALQDGHNVLITVKDSGMGIPEKNKGSIFDMFTESKMNGTSGEKPNGLGLSISLQIAKAHGGNIWFESEEGRGSTFYFSFPDMNDAGA